MIRTYTYKLYKNKQIEQKFYQWLGTCRYVYNVAKEAKEAAYVGGINLHRFDLQKQMVECKKEDELNFIKQINAQTLQSVISRLDRSFKSFFERRLGYPKWASRKTWKSFEFPQNSGGVRQTPSGFRLPKFGTVKVFNNRKIDGDIKAAILIKKADGIYIHVTAEVVDKIYCTNENQVGIDMGISYFATLSDGLQIDNPRFLEKQLKKLRIEQRSLSRKMKGSNRRNRQVNVVARLHKKVTDARNDFLHKESTKIARTYGNVGIENLNIKGMVKSKLSRHISDVAWGIFFEMLEYKCNNLVKVDPKYTSQECSLCGHAEKNNRLTQSQFKCCNCGHEANADVDAAKVIMGRAFPNSRKRSGLPQALAVPFKNN